MHATYPTHADPLILSRDSAAASALLSYLIKYLKRIIQLNKHLVIPSNIISNSILRN